MKRKEKKERRRMCYKIIPDMNLMCECGLEPLHKVGEHDWCCQLCGGSHAERICPAMHKALPLKKKSLRGEDDGIL